MIFKRISKQKRLTKNNSFKARFVSKNPFNKYGAKKTKVGDITFDSKKEAIRYQHLLILMKAGHIKDLKRQITFKIEINGVKICSYRADFTYLSEGKEVVEDVKGFLTKEYVLKRKLMLAVHGITINEV